MHEEFESYKNELDRVRLTEESKKALAESLRRREIPARSARRSRRLTAGAGRIAAAAAVICLLMTGAVAAVVGNLTLRDQVFGGGAGYDQSSGFVGRSVEKDGWTVTITDCVGDDRNLYLGIEVEAPEGVVLDAGNYRFLEYSDDFIRGGGSGGMDLLPDSDPTDNKIQFVQQYYNAGFYFDSKGFSGRSRYVLKKLVHDFYWEVQENDKLVKTYVEDCGATWDFGYLEVSYLDSTIRLNPNLPVTTLDVEATITSVEVSPLSAVIRIEGDALLYHHNWVPKNAPDGFYGCIEYQEVYLYTEDGEVIPANYKDGASAGGGCSGGTVEEEPFIVLDRRFDSLIDVDNLTAISVCGVMIPLR